MEQIRGIRPSSMIEDISECLTTATYVFNILQDEENPEPSIVGRERGNLLRSLDACKSSIQSWDLSSDGYHVEAVNKLVRSVWSTMETIRRTGPDVRELCENISAFRIALERFKTLLRKVEFLPLVKVSEAEVSAVQNRSKAAIGYQLAEMVAKRESAATLVQRMIEDSKNLSPHFREDVVRVQKLMSQSQRLLEPSQKYGLVSQRITVLGSAVFFSKQQLEKLVNHGILVRFVLSDYTLIENVYLFGLQSKRVSEALMGGKESAFYKKRPLADKDMPLSYLVLRDFLEHFNQRTFESESDHMVLRSSHVISHGDHIYGLVWPKRLCIQADSYIDDWDLPERSTISTTLNQQRQRSSNGNEETTPVCRPEQHGPGIVRAVGTEKAYPNISPLVQTISENPITVATTVSESRHSSPSSRVGRVAFSLRYRGRGGNT